jgi:hypothetical protein
MKFKACFGFRVFVLAKTCI